MPKRRIFDLVEGYHRIPRITYQKVVDSKGPKQSINGRLCAILAEYFAMKEAEEAQKQIIVQEG
jgi:hypothetical protein